MKKSLTILMMAIILLVTASKVEAAGATLTLSPASGTFNKGCGFTINVLLDTGGAATDGTDAIIFYDPTRFKANQIRSGTIYADYPRNLIDAQNGKITISGLASVSTAFTGAGTLGTIDFEVLSTAPEGATQMTFDFDASNPSKTTDSNVAERGTVADILSAVGNGSYLVGTGSCTAVSPTQTPGGSGMYTLPVGSPVTVTATPIPATLPQAGVLENTLMIVAIGSALTILGILGLVLL